MGTYIARKAKPPKTKAIGTRQPKVFVKTAHSIARTQFTGGLNLWYMYAYSPAARAIAGYEVQTTGNKPMSPPKRCEAKHPRAQTAAPSMKPK